MVTGAVRKQRREAQKQKNIELMLACKEGNVNTILNLLRQGADVNGTAGCTPLGSATIAKRIPIMETLLQQHYIDINAPHQGKSSLHIAANTAFVDGVKLLLKYGADTKKEDKWQKTPSYYAAFYNDTEILGLLEAAEIAKQEQKRLEEERRAKAIVQEKLDALRAIDETGHSTLYHQCRANKREEITKLLRNGADPNLRRNNFCFAPLHFLCNLDKGDIHIEIAEELIKAGADLNSIWTLQLNGGGIVHNSPLHLAVAAGYYKMIKLMAIAGSKQTAQVSISVDGKETRTPCEALCEFEAKKIKPALSVLWTPETHYLFPVCVRRAITCTFLISKRLKWPFDKTMLERICSHIPYNFYGLLEDGAIAPPSKRLKLS